MALGATCVQKLNGSRDSAIHTKYHILLRSSSMREPRYPLPRVVCDSKEATTNTHTANGTKLDESVSFIVFLGTYRAGVDYAGNPKDAEKILQRTISEFRYHLHGPRIAVIECPDVNLMKLGIRALDDFPCVSIPSNARDSQYPALSWQIVAAKIGMRRCAASSCWLNERISLPDSPIFELDWLIHTTDVFFARALRDQQQILWVSDNGIPDLGGDIEEETCYSDEIHHLAVNALLKSNQINEMEGDTLFGFDHDLTSGSHLPNEQLGLDDATSCAPAFRVLKQLIQRCLADVVSSGNIFADAM
ncbi:hypothetical protein L2E82_49977 [Cichorium intybus]|nr:hypothetical protein L2E82_49977 [Cichorium intybus]